MSSTRLGVVMDPISQINPKKDSTLAMLLEAQARGFRIQYFEQADLRLEDGDPWGYGRELSVTDDSDDWYRLGAVSDLRLADLDVILMRKDPPFDTEYIFTTYILERAELTGTLIVNQPNSLRDISEKVFTAWFPDCCPPTLITRSMRQLRGFLQEQRKIVIKPLDGMGGRSIFVVNHDDNNANVIFETLTDYDRRFSMAQKYVPEIVAGDKRILMIAGKPASHVLARIPQAGDNRGNLVAGALAEARELTDRDRWICDRVGPILRDRGVLFAGLDVIGDFLTEINVTSPTGIRELAKLAGTDIAGQLMDVIEARLRSVQ